MQIACLGWGSLIWKPGELPLASEWSTDGPYLPIEFARESLDGRITLVLVDSGRTVQSLWSQLNIESMDGAKSALATREGITEKNIKYSVGYWNSVTDSSHGRCSEEVKAWALRKGLDGVVWTNLKYGFKDNRDEMPEISQILVHLNRLSPQDKAIAEEYVRKTPVQVATEFRTVFESELGWGPL